jgi:hypothetical protein
MIPQGEIMAFQLGFDMFPPVGFDLKGCSCVTLTRSASFGSST